MSIYLSREGKRFINCKISEKFINMIKNNYGNKITISEYLIERLKFKKINNAFVTGWKHTSPLITPIQKCALKIDNFAHRCAFCHDIELNQKTCFRRLRTNHFLSLSLFPFDYS